VSMVSMVRTVRLETRLPCSPTEAWERVQRPALLEHVAAPWIRFRPVDPPRLPERWAPGTYRVAMQLLGVVPLGEQDIGVRFPESHPEAPPGARILRDAGSGRLGKTWDHWIFIAPHPEGGTLYVDRVEVGAGVLTPVVALFARGFYAWRQHRWRQLVG